MRILYVSQYFPPEMGAPAARVSELAQHWAKDGHDVTVLTGFPNHPTGRLHPRYHGKLRQMVLRENLGDVNVLRTWLFPLPNRKPYERMLNYSSFALSASATGTFISRPEIVIATSPQLLVGLAGYWLALAKRVPFIFEVRDLWPESLSAVGLGLQTSMMNRTLGKIADFLYARASRIVAVSPAIREHLVTARGISPEKVSTVANGVETAIFHPDDSCAAAKERLKVSKKFVVGYIGTIGLAHGLETLLQAAESLKATAPDIAFLIVGEGAEKQRILHLATERNLTNCIFLGQQPREEIPALLNACDACLVMLRAADVFRTVIPTKMLEMMACARPVIVAVDGQARSIVEQANAGIFVPPENAAALVKAISVLKNNPDLGRQLGQNGRDHILAYYARRNTAAQYIAVLDEVLARSAMAAAVA